MVVGTPAIGKPPVRHRLLRGLYAMAGRSPRRPAGDELDETQARIAENYINLPRWLGAAVLGIVVVSVSFAVRTEAEISGLKAELAGLREQLHSSEEASGRDFVVAVQQSEMDQSYIYNLRVWLAEHGIAVPPEPPQNALKNRATNTHKGGQ